MGTTVLDVCECVRWVLVVEKFHTCERLESEKKEDNSREVERWNDIQD